jgi:hypothetical protein
VARGEPPVSVAMSNADFAVLVHAAGWVEQHSGTDAPEYPQMDMLTHVVDGISRRRHEPSDDGEQSSFSFERRSELRKHGLASLATDSFESTGDGRRIR